MSNILTHSDENKNLKLINVDEENCTVSAKELHYFLQVGRDFSNWIKARIEKYDFEEGEDFTPILVKSTGGRPSVDYTLSLDMAKELAMVENNEKGKEARKYFIEVEKRFQKAKLVVQSALPNDYLSALEALTAQVRQNVEQQKLLQVANEQVQQATLQLQEAQPKIAVYQQIMDAEDAVDLGVAAKEYGLGKNNFMRLLRDHKILITGGDMRNTPYQVYGHHFKVVSKTIPGLNKLSYKTYIRPSGLAWLAKGFAKNPEVLQQYK